METRLFSTILATAKAATIVIGKIAAEVPIVVPMIKRVNGLIATKKMINGIGRMILISKFRNINTNLFSNKLPLRVTYSTKPIISPRILAKISVTTTIKSVSPVASTTLSQNVSQLTLMIDDLPDFHRRS
ncbi:hypothetical protein D1872_227100 [compost metagenome]